MADYIIGIDIGGTTIKIGVIYHHGGIFKKWEIPTNTSNEGKSIIDDIWRSLDQRLQEELIDRVNILGIGIGAPGFLDVESGFVFEAVNIGWKNVALADQLKKRSGLPVFLENDANVAVLGENWKGAGNQAKNVIAITLGTGVGGGIIANGTVVDGENGMAGEIGHMTIDPNGYPCNCGRRGCLETIVSATGIVRQATQVISENPTSKLAAFVKKHGWVTTKDIFQLAEAGDKLSEGIIQHTAEILGMFIANMAVTLNPSKVLIGGGVSKAGKPLLNKIVAVFDTYALPRAGEVCDIKIAQLGNDAGIIGSAFLVKQKALNATF